MMFDNSAEYFNNKYTLRFMFDIQNWHFKGIIKDYFSFEKYKYPAQNIIFVRCLTQLLQKDKLVDKEDFFV